MFYRSCDICWRLGCGGRPHGSLTLGFFTLLDLCVSSLRKGHANILCIVPILTDDPRRESSLTLGFFSCRGEKGRLTRLLVQFSHLLFNSRCVFLVAVCVRLAPISYHRSYVYCCYLLSAFPDLGLVVHDSADVGVRVERGVLE